MAIHGLDCDRGEAIQRQHGIGAQPRLGRYHVAMERHHDRSDSRRSVRALRRTAAGWQAASLATASHGDEQPVTMTSPATTARDGDIVLCEPAEGHTLRLVGTPLARAGSLRAGLYRIVLAAGADPTYPTQVQAEVAALAAAPGIDEETLADLRSLPFVTIDNHDARDLDQALHIARDGAGYRVWYAIADASHFVRPGTALFDDSLARGSSYYLPGLAVPMLPRSLSEGIVSLNPRVDRRALVFDMRLGADGSCHTTRLVRARIRSVRKLSYRMVQRLWDDPGGSPLRQAEFVAALRLLAEVGELRVGAARRRHIVAYHRHETMVRFDGERGGFSVLGRERLPVERCNEQISLLCNIEGARLLLAARRAEHVQPIFRVHPAPSPEALVRLGNLIAAIARTHGLDPARWSWRPNGDEPLADYLERLPRRGADAAITRTVERQVLLANQRSSFDPVPGPHYGVGAAVYARCSAPMREIVGVFTHKEVLEALGEPPQPDAADVALRDLVVAAGNRAKERQRGLTKAANRLVLDWLFEADMARAPAQRPTMKGTVLGATPSRLYLQLDQPPVEVKVHLEDLAARSGGQWRLADDEVSIASPEAATPIRLGDRVRVRVAGLDTVKDRWTFDLDRM